MVKGDYQNEFWIHFLPHFNPIAGQIKVLPEAWRTGSLDWALPDLLRSSGIYIVLTIALLALFVLSARSLYRQLRRGEVLDLPGPTGERS